MQSEIIFLLLNYAIYKYFLMKKTFKLYHQKVTFKLSNCITQKKKFMQKILIDHII